MGNDVTLDIPGNTTLENKPDFPIREVWARRTQE